MEFVHLHCHTDGSLLDGLMTPRSMIQRAIKLGCPAVAITDHGTLCNTIEFLSAAKRPFVKPSEPVIKTKETEGEYLRKLQEYDTYKDATIKPIIGMEAYLYMGDMVFNEKRGVKEPKARHIVLLAKNTTGYGNLVELATLSYGDKRKIRSRPTISLEMLEERAEGLIGMSACISGVVALDYELYGEESATHTAMKMSDIFSGDFYMEIMHRGSKQEMRVMSAIANIAKDCGIPIVATNDAHFTIRDEAFAQKVLLCIQIHKTIDEALEMENSLISELNDELYMKSYDEMVSAVSRVLGEKGAKEALERSLEIASKIDLDLSIENDVEFPDIDIDRNDKIMFEKWHSKNMVSRPKMQAYLAYLVINGLKDKGLLHKDGYLQRAKEELRAIYNSGFTAYFIMTKRIVDFARNHGIRVGPGRGSGAGSLCCYALGITNLDPIKHGLMFERFLNIGRQNKYDFNFEEYPIERWVDSCKSGNDEQTLRAIMIKNIKERGFDDYVFQKSNRELGFLENQELCGYFLDLYNSNVKYKNTPNSWLAYVIGITDEEPKSGLRIIDMGSPPDIDLDFDDSKREHVLNYIIEEYGRDNTAAIGTFGVFAAKGAVKFTVRALNIAKDDDDYYNTSIALSEEISKTIPDTPGITIEEALASSSGLRLYASRYPEVFEVARLLEGTKKYAGKHAAGVVISKEPLSKLVPLHSVGGTVTTQYTFEELGKIGLIKFDILGLRTLHVISDCVKWVRERHGIDLSNIDEMDDIIYNDRKTIELLRSADTDGVFQLESEGMRDALLNLKPDSFDDINTIVAAFRPGPKKFLCKDFYDTYKDSSDPTWSPGMTYAENKANNMKDVKYAVPELKDILSETYGVIIYQEQVIAIAKEIAGFSSVEADLLRYAMGKKMADKMDELKPKFISGFAKKGYSEDVANEIWDTIYKFSSYAFNKSHSTAYAKLAFQTAYLKANYPVEFYAALLTSFIGKEDRIKYYMASASRRGINFSEVSVNKSGNEFIPEGDMCIRPALGCIKGVGDNAKNIVKFQPYRNLYEFCKKVGTSLNKTIIEALGYAGAFKEFGYRPEDAIEKILNTNGELRKRDRRAKPKGEQYQVSEIFDMAMFEEGNDNL